jgi:hypothetical protein
MSTDAVATLAANLIEKDRAIDAAITALGALKADVVRLQRERDSYRQALAEIHGHAADNYDGGENGSCPHRFYLEASGVALGLIP